MSSKAPPISVKRSPNEQGSAVSPASPSPSPKAGARPVLKQRHGVCSQQGRRPYQEDRAAAHASDGELTAYGVFDGHGGDEVSRLLVGPMDFLGRHLTAVKAAASAGFQIADALGHVYTTTHKEVLSRKNVPDTCGSCSVTAVIQHKPDGSYYVHVANSGDSRCLLYNSRTHTAVRLSYDHKPDLPAEKARIEARGGAVLSGRLFGGRGATAVSRSLGDRAFTVHGLVSDPHVRTSRLGPSDAFLLLCSDGLTEQMTDDEVCSAVAARLAQGDTPAQAADAVVHRAIQHPDGQQRQSNDNVTAMVVQFSWVVPPGA